MFLRRFWVDFFFFLPRTTPATKNFGIFMHYSSKISKTEFWRFFVVPCHFNFVQLQKIISQIFPVLSDPCRKFQTIHFCFFLFLDHNKLKIHPRRPFSKGKQPPSLDFKILNFCVKIIIFPGNLLMEICTTNLEF